MSAIRNKTYELIEKIPDDYIYWLNELIKKFIADKEFENEDEKLARWQTDHDKYEQEISDFIKSGIKASRYEDRAKNNENLN